jgi:hypothetical protein
MGLSGQALMAKIAHAALISAEDLLGPGPETLRGSGLEKELRELARSMTSPPSS